MTDSSASALPSLDELFAGVRAAAERVRAAYVEACA